MPCITNTFNNFWNLFGEGPGGASLAQLLSVPLYFIMYII